MATVVRDVKELLLCEGVDPDDTDTIALWDEEVGAVPGGVNWADRYAGDLDGDSFFGVTGPEVSDTVPPW
jgi:CRISPR-associated protein Cas1